MTQPSNVRRKPRSPWGWLLLAGLVLLALLALTLALLLRPGRGAAPFVSIRQPIRGSRISAVDGGIVVVEASGSSPIARYLLWVNGAPQGFVDSPDPAQSLAASVRFRWIPESPGPHILVATAYDQLGLAGRSEPVVVDVAADKEPDLIGIRVEILPEDTAESVAARTGLPADALSHNLPSGAAPPQQVIIPVPRDQLPASFFGEGGPEPARPESDPSPPSELLLPGSLPLVSVLTAEAAGGCQVRLAWRFDTQGSAIRLYRFGGLAQDFTFLADVERGATDYLDTLPFGGEYLYVIASVRREGEVAGPMQRIEISPDVCPNQAALPDSGLAWMQFEATRLITDDALDRAYCYFSLDGERFQRIPAAEDSSLTRLAEGWDFTPFLAGIRKQVFEHDVQAPVSVRMDCWGWRGGELLPLGTLTDSRPREDWSSDLAGMGPRFQLLYSLLTYHNDLPLTHELFYAGGPPPPPFRVRFATSALDCLGHVNLPGGTEAFGGENLAWAWGCLVIPNVLIWEWPPNADWTLEEVAGYQVRLDRDYRVTDPESRIPIHQIEREARNDPLGESGSANQAMPAPAHPACLRSYGYTVRVFQDDPDEGRRYSEPSRVFEDVRADCPDAVVVEFTLLDIEVRHLDDGCVLFCSGESLQAYGSGEWLVHSASSDSLGNPVGDTVSHVARTDFWTTECDAGFGGGCVFAPRTVHNGTIDLAVEDLRRCQGGACGTFGPDNNTVRLILGEDDSVEFSFVLWDVDGVEDDVWCGTMEDVGLRDRIREGLGLEDIETAAFFVGLGPKSLRGWAETDFVDTFQNVGVLDDQDSECTLRVGIQGLGLFHGGIP